jgi:hypothetical protein
MTRTQQSSSTRPIPGTRSVLMGRLVTPPVLHETGAGGRMATLRITASDVEHTLVVFGRRAQALDRLPAGHAIHAEGCWQARQGRAPELAVDHLSLQLPGRDQGSTT